MKSDIRMMLLVALFFVAAPCWAGTEWHVDNQATGVNDGTSWTDAYTNFTVAVSNVWGSGANTGATIYVRQAIGAPDYISMGLEVGDGFSDGTPDAYNRIVGWTGEGYAARPLLVRTNYGPVINLGVEDTVSRNCYEFNSLHFQGNSLYWSASVSLAYASSNVRFLNNVCTNASFRCTETHEPYKTNLLFRANLFGRNSGCYLRYSSDVQILDNQVLTKAGTSPAISLGYSNKRVLIQDNIIESGDGISSQGGNDIIIERNRITASYRAAIFNDNWPTSWVIRNNIFHGATGSHASWPEGRGLVVSRNPSLVVVNNTFYDFPEEGAIAIALGANVRDAIVFNNVISGVTSGLVAAAESTFTNDFNVFWNVNMPHGGIAVTGPNDRLADPQFKNPAAFDFSLGNEDLRYSAAKVFMGEVAPIDDYFGLPRGKAISFGAVQSPFGGTTLILR